MRVARIAARPTATTGGATLAGVKLDQWLPLAVGALGLVAALGWIERGRFAPRSPRLGRVHAVLGKATSDGAGAAPGPLSAGVEVGAGEHIEVAATARVVLDFPDAATVAAGPGASFDVLHLRPLELQLRRGRLVLRGQAMVYTREGDAALQGGLGAVEARDGETVVRAAGGRMRVRGAGHTFDLHTAERIAFRKPEGNGAVTPPTPEADPSAPSELEGAAR